METTENSSSTELTSTLTDSNDATQTLTGDSVPSSSSDANLGSSYSKTIQDDPISSTSDSVSTYNFNDEKEDFFSSDLNIENIRTEKINEDVEDIATDLENLLGETSNDYLIPLNKNTDKDGSNIDENTDNKTAGNQEVDSTNKKYIKNDEHAENVQKESTLDSTSCSESNVLDNSLSEGTNLDVNGKVMEVKLVNLINDDKLGAEKTVGSSKSGHLVPEVNNDPEKEKNAKNLMKGEECVKKGEENLMESQKCLLETKKGSSESEEGVTKTEKCLTESPKDQKCVMESITDTQTHLTEGSEEQKCLTKSVEGQQCLMESQDGVIEIPESQKSLMDSQEGLTESQKSIMENKKCQESVMESQEDKPENQEDQKSLMDSQKGVTESKKCLMESQEEVLESPNDQKCSMERQEGPIESQDGQKSVMENQECVTKSQKSLMESQEGVMENPESQKSSMESQEGVMENPEGQKSLMEGQEGLTESQKSRESLMECQENVTESKKCLMESEKSQESLMESQENISESKKCLMESQESLTESQKKQESLVDTQEDANESQKCLMESQDGVIEIPEDQKSLMKSKEGVIEIPEGQKSLMESQEGVTEIPEGQKSLMKSQEGVMESPETQKCLMETQKNKKKLNESQEGVMETPEGQKCLMETQEGEMENQQDQKNVMETQEGVTESPEDQKCLVETQKSQEHLVERQEDQKCVMESQKGVTESSENQKCLVETKEDVMESQECSNIVPECPKELPKCPKDVQECSKEVEEVNKEQSEVIEHKLVENEAEEIKKGSEAVQEVVEIKKDDKINDVQVEKLQDVLLPESSIEHRENETVQEEDKNDVEVKTDIKIVEEVAEIKPNNELKEINEKNEPSEILKERKLDDDEIKNEITQESDQVDAKKIELEFKIKSGEPIKVPLESGEAMEGSDDVIESEKVELNQTTETHFQESDVNDKTEDKEVVGDLEKVNVEENLIQSNDEVKENENVTQNVDNVQEMEVENVSEIINETIQSENVNDDEKLSIKTINKDEKGVKMTITSIIEEAIQEEIEKVEVVSAPEINEVREIKNVEISETIEPKISDESQNTEINDQISSKVVSVEEEVIKEEEKLIEVAQINLNPANEELLKENKTELIEEKELETENKTYLDETESEAVESSQINNLTPPIKSDLKQGEPFNPQSENSEIVKEQIKSISVIPDSLDEGNIAALAICEPSNMEYFQIQVDLTSQSENKVEDAQIIEYEKEIETVHLEERVKYPMADDSEVIATAAALTANQTIQSEANTDVNRDVDKDVNKDINKDNLEILDIEEENVVVQHIIETTKKSSRNKSDLLPQSCSEIQPLMIDVESPTVEGKDEALTPQYSSKMSTKEVLKLTITKHKTDSPKEEDSILKIYDPKDQKGPKKDVIPKLIIKPVRGLIEEQIDEQEQSIPKLLIRNMSPNRPGSPKVKHQKIETSSSSSSLKVTIKTVKNDEENFTPKITIKPIVKPEDETKISPRITIKPLIRPDDDLKDYKEKDEDRCHSPRITIKPIIKGDEPKILNEEMVHSPRITIKPIKPPDEEECSPKITIKPLIKPQEEDRHEKKEGSPKIKIKPIVKPVEETIESIDFEDQIKQERIVLKINTKESRKREASEEIEKLAKIKLKFSKEGGHAHIVSDQKLKRGSDSHETPENKRAKIDLTPIDLPGFSEKEIEKDDSNTVDDPIDAIPTFQINTQSQQKPQPAPIASIPPVVVPPPPRKRGRPRKIPLVVREEFKDPKDEETEAVTPVVEDTGRPKRSCRGPSVCTTLGIKPRKPRGGGAGGRGRGRGRGSRGGSRGGNRQQRVSTRSKLLLEEDIVETSDYRRLAVDEIIEIPDDDPKEEEHPPQPLPPTHHHHHREVIESPPGVDDTGNTESVTGEKISSDGGSDVVLIEEETRMSADIHSSRAHTPAKVLAVADIDDTQSSVQSTATTESVKVRKGSRLEVHPEQDDIISPEQLAEYYWSGSGPYMIQEQVAQFLGIKSFKRKYPGIQRRPVDMQERDFIRENCLASEAMCDMGLTAVASADILDIMYSDFQPKYEEYCKHQRDRHTKEIINKQKALSLVLSQEKSKHDLTQQAMQSAASWNVSFNRTRKEDRKACMDLQTFTINYPKGRFKVLDKGKIGSYPIALVPGQYTDHYKEYSPNEIYNLPLNTMMNQTLSIVRDDDDSQSDGSGSDSDTTSSDSDSSSSDSSDEDCNLCANQVGPRKVSAN